MPVYKLVVKQTEPVHHNGKIYQNGDTKIERIVITEAEAKLVNERDNQVSAILIEEPKGETLRPLNQMNKPELQKVGKEIDLDLDDSLTRKQMVEAINARKEELKSL